MLMVACSGLRATAASLVASIAKKSSVFSRIESSMMVIVTGSLSVFSSNVSCIGALKSMKSVPAAGKEQ